MVAILSNQIKTKNMKQELITRIGCILNFMEEFETLVNNAKKDGDEEWENELHARLSFAESDLRNYIGLLLGIGRSKMTNCRSDDKISNKFV